MNNYAITFLHTNDTHSYLDNFTKRMNGQEPARSTVQVAGLPKDVPVEIEVIAVSE